VRKKKFALSDVISVEKKKEKKRRI